MQRLKTLFYKTYESDEYLTLYQDAIGRIYGTRYQKYHWCAPNIIKKESIFFIHKKISTVNRRYSYWEKTKTHYVDFLGNLKKQKAMTYLAHQKGTVMSSKASTPQSNGNNGTTVYQGERATGVSESGKVSGEVIGFSGGSHQTATIRGKDGHNYDVPSSSLVK